MLCVNFFKLKIVKIICAVVIVKVDVNKYLLFFIRKMYISASLNYTFVFKK